MTGILIKRRNSDTAMHMQNVCEDQSKDEGDVFTC